ncbi:MAG: hypothetical protein ACJAS1_006405, partial [Oleiphilaceae bacterium]
WHDLFLIFFGDILSLLVLPSKLFVKESKDYK